MPVDCDAITDAILRETGRINDSEVFRRTVRGRPINELMMEHRGQWKLGRGIAQSNLTTARNMPLGAVASRTNIEASDNSTVDACDPPIVTLNDGQITQNFQLRHLAEQTRDYCIVDLSSAVAFARWMAHRKAELADITRWTWAEWFTLDYHEIAGHNLTQLSTGSGFWDNGSNGYSTAHPPTAGLSPGLLEDLKNQQFLEGEPYARDPDTGESVGILIIGEAMSRNLLRLNTTLAEQIRYAWMGKTGDSPLLPGGMSRKKRQFGGWIHLIDPYPRRFDLVLGAYQQRQPFTSTAVTKGTNDELADAYRYAMYEEVIVWTPHNYRSLVPDYSPLTNNGFPFAPQNNTGEFHALNIQDKLCNPDRNKVFFRAVYRDAAEPINPKLGYTILAKNCGFDKTGPACTPASSSSA